MRRAAYHRARGDEILFPYHGEQAVDRVSISTVFTRNRPLLARLLLRLTGREWDLTRPDLCDSQLEAHGIEIGGTGWQIHRIAPREVEACRPDYSLYDPVLGPANYGQGFTSRGCPRGCRFCVVPEMSGSIVTPVATLADLRNGERRWIRLMDDNFWAPGNAWVERLTEAIDHKLDLSFTQGLDIRFADQARAEMLARVRFWDANHQHRQVTFAFDSPRLEGTFRRGFEILMRAGLKPNEIKSFVLTGFDSLPEEDDRRLAVLRELGILPFVMVYEPIRGETVPPAYQLRGWSEEQYRRHRKRCRHLQRWANRVALWRVVLSFERYEPWVREQELWREQDGRPLVFPLG